MACLKGLFVTLLVAACLLHGSEAHLSCEPPPDGRYRIFGNAPDPDSDVGYIPFADSTVELTQQFDNLYVGEGSGGRVRSDDDEEEPPSADFSFVAIFSPEFCTLSGAAVVFEGRGMDVFVWDVFGDEMRGDYVGVSNGTVAFERFGLHEVNLRG